MVVEVDGVVELSEAFTSATTAITATIRIATARATRSPLEPPCWGAGVVRWVAGGSGIAVGGYHLPSVACHQPCPPDWSDTSISSRVQPASAPRCTLEGSRRRRSAKSDSPPHRRRRLGASSSSVLPNDLHGRSTRRCGTGVSTSERTTTGDPLAGGSCLSDQGLLPALGGTRTPNLLIRRPDRGVHVVLSNDVLPGQVGCVFQQLLSNLTPWDQKDGQLDGQQPANYPPVAPARLRAVLGGAR